MVVLLPMLITGCGKSEPISGTDFFFDTIITITVYDSSDERILDSCMEMCRKYEALLSRTVETSDVSRINQAMGKPVTVSPETITLLQEGIRYGELSGGLFDITIAPASSLWDFTAESPALPDPSALSEAVSHVDYRKISISGNTVTMADADAQIDLGGIAKGYIADRLKEYLVSQSVNHAVINLGGNVLTVGGRPDGTPFRVGIQRPFDERNSILTTVDVTGRSVVSSGSYERYFIWNDTLCHHILDPSTGYPIDSGLAGVTILSDYSVDGDALSTTCFALGKEKGMELIQTLDGVDALFIDTDGNASATFPVNLK